jgi:hypothetical protein
MTQNIAKNEIYYNASTPHRDLLYISGSLNNNEFDFLVDSGASANFISTSIV